MNDAQDVRSFDIEAGELYNSVHKTLSAVFCIGS